MDSFKTNNFAKYKNISSILLFGNPHICNNEEISICIPAYGRFKLLKEAIMSSLNQITDKKYKLIIVDDNPDIEDKETLLYLKTFGNKNILYYKNTRNLGLFGNMNRCVELAQTKYVTILHDDDLLKSTYIETITKYLNKKDIDCICVPFDHINSPFKTKDKQKVFKVRKSFNFLKTLFSDKLLSFPDADNYFLHRNIFGPPTCGVVYKRNSILKAGGWDENFFPTSDWFFMLEFNKRFKVFRIAENLAFYRWESNTSLKPNIMAMFFEHSIQIVNSYRERYKIFYPEIVRQIINEYESYGVKISDERKLKFSSTRMRILILIQKFLNFRYFDFNIN